jgi:hypothetical protein
VASVNAPVVTFSGGIIGQDLANRVDIPTYAQGAEVMQNFHPTVQGVMQRRPPFLFVDDFEDHNKKGRLFPFIYDIDKSYLVLAMQDGFKIYADNVPLSVPVVTASIAAAGSTAFTNQLLTATFSASSTGGGATTNLNDNDASTHWYASTAGTEHVTADLGSAATLRSIWITAGTAWGTWAPTAFTVLGSATGSFSGEETTLLTVTGAAWSNGETKKYRLTATGSFRYYRLNMTANGGGTHHLLAEVRMFGSAYLDLSSVPAAVAISGTSIVLDSDGGNTAILEIPISINETSVRHVLAFEVIHGPLDIRIGTTSAGTDLMDFQGLRAGLHRLSFTPGTATVYVQFRHAANAGRWIKNNISIIANGTYTVPCPYLEADLPKIHRQQIRDVLYLVHNDYWPRRLERRGSHSWSIVKLLPEDGPFGDINTTTTTLAANYTSGEITLTASEGIFTANDVGVLYSLSGPGQIRTATATAADVYTEGIKVTGIGTGRVFNFAITGTFVGTVTLQRSSGNENSYTDWLNYTAATSVDVGDSQDNQTWYYRLAVKPGNYTSGTIVMTLTYAGGSTTGIVRVIDYSSPTQVIAEVLSTISDTAPVTTWKRGSWSVTDGYPNCITDGYARLWLGRGDKVWASASDDFTRFEEIIDEADSSFSRNMATPSSDGLQWLAMLSNLILGTSSIEKVGLANTSSEPVGPSNFQFMPGSEEGGNYIQPIAAGGSLLFVHRNRRQLMQFTQNPKALSETSYIAVDLTARAPDVLDARIVAIDVQREPERRIYVVLESGRLCELLFRREGDLDVVAWSVVQTQGRVEDLVVIPREGEDTVYAIVRRRNAANEWRRYIERLGSERVIMDCDRFHLDSAVALELTKPDTVATPSGTTGSVTVAVDDDTFVNGDIGKVLWINGGRGTITARANGYTVTMTVTSELDTADPCPSQRWGMRTPTASMSGLSHLEGLSVRIWGDMADLGTATVSSGAITLPQSVSVAYAGIPYTSRWKSLKLAYGAQKGTALGMRKAIKSIILLLYKCGASLTYGKAIGTGLKRSFIKQRAVPTRTPDVPLGEPLPLFTGEKDHAFDAHYEPDSRLCFEIEGPAPAIISGFVLILDEKDR